MRNNKGEKAKKRVEQRHWEENETLKKLVFTLRYFVLNLYVYSIYIVI